jgi:hypothetical protein
VTLLVQPTSPNPFSVFLHLSEGSRIRRIEACKEHLSFLVTRVFLRSAIMVESAVETPVTIYESDTCVYPFSYEASKVLRLDQTIGMAQVLGIDFEIIGFPSVLPFCYPTVWFERSV